MTEEIEEKEVSETVSEVQVPAVVETVVPPAVVETVVPPAVVETVVPPAVVDLDKESKVAKRTTKVIFIYPQSQEPELSIDGGEFIKLPFNSSRVTLDIEYKDYDIFPITVIYKNEFITFKKQVIDYFGGINANQVSIQRG